MTARDSEITPLDPRFPIRLESPAPIFWELNRTWPDRTTADSEASAAIRQAMRGEERYVAPLPPGAPLPVRTPRRVPEALHHADTVDWAWTDGDRFRPEDTLVVGDLPYRPESPRVMEREMQAAERRHVGHRARRAIGRLAGALREQPPGGGVL